MQSECLLTRLWKSPVLGGKGGGAATTAKTRQQVPTGQRTEEGEIIYEEEKSFFQKYWQVERFTYFIRLLTSM